MPVTHVHHAELAEAAEIKWFLLDFSLRALRSLRDVRA
jgi:hypothetical protein